MPHTDEDKQPSRKYAEYGDILFAITSEDIPFVGNSVAYVGKERILVGGDIVVMKHNQNPKYVSYAVSTIDEGIEILTGVPAGKRNKDGKYPAGTIKYLAYEKLEKYNKNANKLNQ